MSRNGRPPSMADVAQLVGVSHQTVSRVVNGKGRVSPRTRGRVQAAIVQLGYRPNSVARALVTARSGIIGVVTTTSAHVGPSSMLIALEITAREAGFFTSVVPLDRFNVEDMASTFDHFSSLAAEAIIVITPMDSLAEAGVSVPGDVSVAGFDDVPLAAYAGPGLTKVALACPTLAALGMATGCASLGILWARIRAVRRLDSVEDATYNQGPAAE